MVLESTGVRTAKRVAVVSGNKAHVEMDMASLKKIDMDFVKACPSGTSAFQLLSSSGCDILICDSEIQDMDAKTFLRTVKNNPSMKHVPVVMVTTDNDRNAVLDAVAAGCSGYILRPYSQETFERHLATALQLLRFSEIEMRQIEDAKLMLEVGEYDDAIEEFEEVLSLQSEAEKYYDLGCKYLIREKYGKAIVAFQKALKLNDLFAEAYQGLSEAFKGRGEVDQAQFYLKRAADVYAEFDRMEKVKELFIDILKYDSAATNPFNSLGVKLRKGGDYMAAIKAYKQALELTPNDENVYYNIGKAYYFMDDYENSLKHLTMALRMNRDFTEAAKLYKELKGAPWPGTGQKSRGVLGRTEAHKDI